MSQARSTEAPYQRAACPPPAPASRSACIGIAKDRACWSFLDVLRRLELSLSPSLPFSLPPSLPPFVRTLTVHQNSKLNRREDVAWTFFRPVRSKTNLRFLKMASHNLNWFHFGAEQLPRYEPNRGCGRAHFRIKWIQTRLNLSENGHVKSSVRDTSEFG